MGREILHGSLILTGFDQGDSAPTRETFPYREPGEARPMRRNWDPIADAGGSPINTLEQPRSDASRLCGLASDKMIGLDSMGLINAILIKRNSDPACPPFNPIHWTSGQLQS